MWKRFAAEILFLNPDDVPAAIDALAAVDCEYEYDPDAIDDYSNAVFGMVTGTTKLSEGEIGSWLVCIIDRFGGDVVQWSYGEPWKIVD